MVNIDELISLLDKIISKYKDRDACLFIKDKTLLLRLNMTRDEIIAIIKKKEKDENYRSIDGSLRYY